MRTDRTSTGSGAQHLAASTDVGQGASGGANGHEESGKVGGGPGQRANADRSLTTTTDKTREAADERP